LDETLTPLQRRVRAGDLELATREWPGDERPFLLLHGLASNACTWDLVAAILNSRGHRVVAYDQRGHGLSDKPAEGYDFEQAGADLRALIDSLGLVAPIVAGQSWGGNVVIDFAARYPGIAAGIVLVDGGFIDLSSRPGSTWESIASDLRPPNLAGIARVDLKQRLSGFHPRWSDRQLEMQLGNFETLPDGSVRPWLTLERHMLILRALWDQKPSTLYEKARTPVLIAMAGSGDAERRKRREQEVSRAVSKLERTEVMLFDGADHDIHVDQPEELAGWILKCVDEGFFI
jgi:pimeloyl-ACP methyl ester carboxylesterase